MKYKANKKDKVKVILTALYRCNELIDDTKPVWAQRINSKMKLPLSVINNEYNVAMKVLTQ